jgi:hypothetical protein
MANLTSTTITGNANVTAEVNAATFAGDAGKTSNLAAGNIASGTLSTDRLPTVPTSKGGTGLTTLGSAGEVLKVTAPGTGLEFGEAGGGNYIRQQYTSPATWTKPAGIQAVKVTVFGGGGNGGNGGNGPTRVPRGGRGGHGGFAVDYISAPSIPGPVSVTAGPGTNSFGAFVSATGGGNGNPGNPGPAASCDGSRGDNGSGSGGQLNLPGCFYVTSATSPGLGTYGWGCVGSPGSVNVNPTGSLVRDGNPGEGFQMGGGGATDGGSVGTGAPGVIVVEEFY